MPEHSITRACIGISLMVHERVIVLKSINTIFTWCYNKK